MPRSASEQLKSFALWKRERDELEEEVAQEPKRRRVADAGRMSRKRAERWLWKRAQDEGEAAEEPEETNQKKDDNTEEIEKLSARIEAGHIRTAKLMQEVMAELQDRGRWLRKSCRTRARLRKSCSTRARLRKSCRTRHMRESRGPCSRRGPRRGPLRGTCARTAATLALGPCSRPLPAASPARRHRVMPTTVDVGMNNNADAFVLG